MGKIGDYRLAPYERRVIELLRNSKDKRARKLAKKRVCSDNSCPAFYLPPPITPPPVVSCRLQRSKKVEDSVDSICANEVS